MKLILAIGVGSFIGGISRYLLARLVQGNFQTAFPYGTLSVNIIGCLLIGVVFGLSERGQISQEWRLFLATGVLGGFTTFSAFSLETIAMMRYGQAWQAGVYILASVAMGLAATWLGFSLVKMT
jgi:fluoride exporter